MDDVADENDKAATLLNSTNPDIKPVWTSNLTNELIRKRSKKLIPQESSKEQLQQKKDDDDSAIGEEDKYCDALDPLEEQITLETPSI